MGGLRMESAILGWIRVRVVGVKKCYLDAFFLCTGVSLAKLCLVISNTFPEGAQGRTQAIKHIHSHVPRNY